jgi:hypothetical protein
MSAPIRRWTAADRILDAGLSVRRKAGTWAGHHTVVQSA